ncbi:unnamed protein product [Gongylonema pulchrum]|uniref:Uncharacterized protein n=1 Tax=Gongylonema pulchrum TaxID=637853 RepID=A0A183DDA0_9BILA|nr:unnamed protein product [Gongylonema pulchrum]
MKDPSSEYMCWKTDNNYPRSSTCESKIQHILPERLATFLAELQNEEQSVIQSKLKVPTVTTHENQTELFCRYALTNRHAGPMMQQDFIKE